MNSLKEFLMFIVRVIFVSVCIFSFGVMIGIIAVEYFK